MPRDIMSLGIKSFAADGVHDKVHDQVHDKVHNWYQDLGTKIFGGTILVRWRDPPGGGFPQRLSSCGQTLRRVADGHRVF